MSLLSIALAAWKIPLVSGFFQTLGFAFEDYETMYHSAVIANPSTLVNNKNLIATFLLIDKCHRFEPAFQSLAQAISGKEGNERKAILMTTVKFMVTDIAQSMSTRA